MISLIRDFETDFLWKVSLKILNSQIILKTFTHVVPVQTKKTAKHVSMTLFFYWDVKHKHKQKEQIV